MAKRSADRPRHLLDWPHHRPVPLRLSRPSTYLCAFLTLLNDRLGESLIFPLLPFLLAGFTGDGRILGLLDAIAMMVLSFWYGTSHSSSIKNGLITKVAEGKQ